MITQLLIIVLMSILSILFALLPTVTVLPSIAGFDIDTAIGNGVAVLYRLFELFWPLEILLQGLLFLLGYFALKLLVKVFFGSRLPTL